MLLKCLIHIRHHLRHNPFLYVYSLKEARETGVENSMHVICIMQAHKGGVNTFGLEVAEEGCSDWSHALNIPAGWTAQREGMENMEERTLTKL